MGDEIRISWESCTFENPGDETALQYVFKKLIDYGVPQKAFNIINDLQISIKRLPPEWIFDALVSIENYGECSIPKYTFADLYSYLFGQLDDGKLEKLEFLSFKLYGRIPYNHGYDDLKPRVTLKKIVNEPEFFIEVVNDVMNDSLGLGKHLLNFCDEKPEAPYDWVVNVNKLIAGESEEFKGNIEYWVGYILYNAIEIVNDDYDIDDVIAGLLEKSDKKRVGFFSHAYYPNGVHSNGNFDEDSKDRINAKKFSDMAIIQDVKGNIKFGESLQEFANSLIKGVE